MIRMRTKAISRSGVTMTDYTPPALLEDAIKLLRENYGISHHAEELIRSLVRTSFHTGAAAALKEFTDGHIARSA